jgi:hypothetical protein
VADDSDDYAAVERGMQLADLRWHWADAYEINWAGVFRAVRRDNGLVLTTVSAEELRTLIRSDYTGHPVPRQPGERIPSASGVLVQMRSSHARRPKPGS